MLSEARINRQRRRLLLSSAAALASGVGLSALSRPAGAAEGEPSPDAPPIVPANAPIFAPKPAWLGTFAPNSINLGGPAGSPADAGLPPQVRSREAWGAAGPAQPYVPQTPRGVSLHHTGAVWNGRPGPE